MKTIDIRPLDRSDDRSGFSCDDPALDRFFQHYAGANQFKLKLGVTYVAVTDGRIIGFATVAAGSIDRHLLPSARHRRRMPTYPLPILRLARLGVDRVVQGGGIGRRLLRHVFKLAMSQRDTLGCVGVVTDAKPGATAFYEKLGFTPMEGVREGPLHGLPTPMFLDIQAIEVALDG